MKTKHNTVATLAATLITFGSLAGGANAALTLNYINSSDSSLEFSISGTISGPDPSGSFQYLFISTNTTDLLSSSDFSPAISGSMSANGNNFNEFYIENLTDADSFTIGYSPGLSIGDSISGTITMTAGSSIVSEQAIIDNGLSLYWGRGPAGGGNPITGTLQAFAPIPEPSSALLLGLGVLAMVARRKRTL